MNSSNKFFYIALVVVATTGFFLGGFWKKMNAPVEDIQVSEDSTYDKNPMTLNPDTKNGNQESPSQPHPMSARNLASVSSRLEKSARFKGLVENNKLQSHFEKLQGHFPETPMGQSLLEFATLLEMQEMAGSPESKYVDEKYQDMKDHPEEAIATLSKVFDELPDSFANERQQLMQYASKLKTDEETKINFVMHEMKRPLKRGSDGKPESVALFNTTSALRSLSNIVGEDASKIEPYLREALDSHKSDKESQRVLIHFFGRFDPEGAKKLHREFGTTE